MLCLGSLSDCCWGDCKNTAVQYKQQAFSAALPIFLNCRMCPIYFGKNEAFLKADFESAHQTVNCADMHLLAQPVPHTLELVWYHATSYRVGCYITIFLLHVSNHSSLPSQCHLQHLCSQNPQLPLEEVVQPLLG